MQITAGEKYTATDVNAVLLSYSYFANREGTHVPTLREVRSKVTIHFRQEYSLVVANGEFYNRELDPIVKDAYNEFLHLIHSGYFDYLVPREDDIRYILEATPCIYFDDYRNSFHSVPLKTLW